MNFTEYFAKIQKVSDTFSAAERRGPLLNIFDPTTSRQTSEGNNFYSFSAVEIAASHHLYLGLGNKKHFFQVPIIQHSPKEKESTLAGTALLSPTIGEYLYLGIEAPYCNSAISSIFYRLSLNGSPLPEFLIDSDGVRGLLNPLTSLEDMLRSQVILTAETGNSRSSLKKIAQIELDFQLLR